MYLVAPLDRELHDLDPEDDVFPLLRAFPDHEPIVGLGFEQEGFTQPAALILHGDDVDALASSASQKTGLPAHVMDDAEYERRALAEEVA